MSDNDDFIIDDEPLDAVADVLPPWVLLIVDDEPQVHDVTRLALSQSRFRNRGLELLSAYSAADARGILAGRDDVAVILLDVVMESDDAGLELVRHIREELGNKRVRIILRTGQPGQAPEREVIINYDINDYKSKTELTAQKLFTATIAGLRSYADISALEQSRRGLEKIIASSDSLSREHSVELLATGALIQLAALLDIGGGGILCAHGAVDPTPMASPVVIAGTGNFDGRANLAVDAHFAPVIAERVGRALRDQRNEYGPDFTVLFVKTQNRRGAAVYLETGRDLDQLDRQLIEVFAAKLSVGLDNVYLFQHLKSAHRATVVALADLAEYKDTDTGNHVLRVADTVEAIAYELRAMGHFKDQLTDIFLEQVGTASILHDIGKVATPDRILLKPGRLDSDERVIMEQHAPNGARILQKARDMVDGSSYLTLGHEIAARHHEAFDGSGYPDGMAGTSIPLSARITAVADVYDALTHRRPYKEPWSRDDALAYISARRGTQFDPEIVDAFMRVEARGLVNRVP